MEVCSGPGHSGTQELSKDTREPVIRYRHKKTNKYICFSRRGRVRVWVSVSQSLVKEAFLNSSGTSKQILSSLVGGLSLARILTCSMEDNIGVINHDLGRDSEPPPARSFSVHIYGTNETRSPFIDR